MSSEACVLLQPCVSPRPINTSNIIEAAARSWLFKPIGSSLRQSLECHQRHDLHVAYKWCLPPDCDELFAVKSCFGLTLDELQGQSELLLQKNNLILRKQQQQRLSY